MFRLTSFITLFTAATALKADSQEGQALLAKSRSLDENAASWVMDYSLVFQSCHVVAQYSGADDADGEDGQAIQYRNLVKYKLCPSKKCRSGCKGAEYLTDMNAFVDAYTEWQMNDKEYKCEQIRENCNCQYYNDDEVCENQCYSKAGMSECIEQDGDDDFNFDLQEYLECKESDAYYRDGYGNQYPLYVGPKCSESGEQINLGVFKDQYCTEEYSSEIFAKYHNGNVLPYQDENIVAENCIACARSVQDNNYYNQYEMVEMCEETYPNSLKCEENLASSLSYPITAGCEYIKHLKQYEKGYEPVSGVAATFFAVVFGLSTLALAGVAVHLYRLNNRKIELHTDAAVV